MDRQKVIVRTSIIGILANIFLAGFKAAVGLISNSISVVLDAVNNLSDALSSVITIIGAKLSAKPSDKKHPMGYGRIEYLSAMIIGVIVLYAGVTSMIESVKKTGKCLIVHEAPKIGGFGMQISALIAENCLADLKKPIVRMGGKEQPIAFGQAADLYMFPKVEEIKDQIRALAR